MVEVLVMNLLKKVWLRELGALVLWCVAFAFVIPPIQSTAEGRVSAFPSTLIGLACFVTSTILMRAQKEAYWALAVKWIVYAVLSLLVVERVRMGVLVGTP
jgi:hypothetical protein